MSDRRKSSAPLSSQTQQWALEDEEEQEQERRQRLWNLRFTMDEDLPAPESTSMRLPASSVKLGLKLEQYLSAIQRSESVRDANPFHTEFPVAPVDVTSKRHLFEKELVGQSREGPATSRKENLELSGVVKSRLNLWISRTQESAQQGPQKISVLEERADSGKRAVPGKASNSEKRQVSEKVTVREDSIPRDAAGPRQGHGLSVAPGLGALTLGGSGALGLRWNTSLRRGLCPGLVASCPSRCSTIVRLLARSVKIDLKVEQYLSALERSEFIRDANRFHAEFPVAPVDVTSKRHLFEKKLVGQSREGPAISCKNQETQRDLAAHSKPQWRKKPEALLSAEKISVLEERADSGKRAVPGKASNSEKRPVSEKVTVFEKTPVPEIQPAPGRTMAPVPAPGLGALSLSSIN
ncbi:hypothetical protein MJG53_001257 [Ovis ammon polii x Ovis aries]|uniref:Uncharacterized protein n=1 Tax=Ovis ammon polii x Ovis aries TaxID=2918886 RepID=A0ACB9VK72_9CETA|nr:hypothetical protein MJG53_001257 [Ovis ammon polii x Ovis aries]